MEDLRGFEREYRSRLKSYFTEQLEALEGSGEGGQLPDGGPSSPKRLKSVSDDQQGDNQGDNQGDDQGDDQGDNQGDNQGDDHNHDGNQGGNQPQG